MINLFSGAGGLTLVFHQNGFDPVETVEIWNPAIETYNFNFKKNVVPQDITKDEVRVKLEKISLLKQGESLYKNYSDGWRRIHYDKPSPTVKENHGGVHIHSTQNEF